jgi:hypothetical protein
MMQVMLAEQVGRGEGSGTGVKEIDLPEGILLDVQHHPDQNAGFIIVVESRFGKEFVNLSQKTVDFIEP